MIEIINGGTFLKNPKNKLRVRLLTSSLFLMVFFMTIGRIRKMQEMQNKEHAAGVLQKAEREPLLRWQRLVAHNAALQSKY